jgi:hypothetical protein
VQLVIGCRSERRERLGAARHGCLLSLFRGSVAVGKGECGSDSRSESRWTGAEHEFAGVLEREGQEFNVLSAPITELHSRDSGLLRTTG